MNEWMKFHSKTFFFFFLLLKIQLTLKCPIMKDMHDYCMLLKWMKLSGKNSISLLKSLAYGSVVTMRKMWWLIQIGTFAVQSATERLNFFVNVWSSKTLIYLHISFQLWTHYLRLMVSYLDFHKILLSFKTHSSNTSWKIISGEH